MEKVNSFFTYAKDYLKSSTSNVKSSIPNSYLNDEFKKLTSMQNLQKNQFQLLMYIVFFILIIIFAIILHFLSKNKNFLQSNMFNTLYLILFPLLVIITLIVFLKKEREKFRFFGIMFLLILVVYGTVSVNNYIDTFSVDNKYYVNILFQITTLIIILLGFTIFYNIFSERIRRLTGVTGFIANFILFIPCLINDFFEYIKEQWKLTSSVVFIILLFEIVFILLFLYLPKLMKTQVVEKGKVLQHEPVFLNKEKIIANSDDLPKTKFMQHQTNKDEATGEIINKHNKNYTLFMWIYLNPHDPSNVPKNIFSYGNVDCYKPKIEYIGTNNSGENYEQKDKFKITFTKISETQKYETYVDVVNQKWNLFAFNYTDLGADLFINGELVRSITFSNNIPSYSNQDKIIIGSSDYLDGSICNVTYSKKVYSKEEIARYYNILFNKNPPLNYII